MFCVAPLAGGRCLDSSILKKRKSHLIDMRCNALPIISARTTNRAIDEMVAFILSYDHYTDVAIPMVEQPSASQKVSDM